MIGFYENLERIELGRVEYLSGRMLTFYETHIPVRAVGPRWRRARASIEFEICVTTANGEKHRHFIAPEQVPNLVRALEQYQARAKERGDQE